MRLNICDTWDGLFVDFWPTTPWLLFLLAVAGMKSERTSSTHTHVHSNVLRILAVQFGSRFLWTQWILVVKADGSQALIRYCQTPQYCWSTDSLDLLCSLMLGWFRMYWQRRIALTDLWRAADGPWRSQTDLHFWGSGMASRLAYAIISMCVIQCRYHGNAAKPQLNHFNSRNICCLSMRWNDIVRASVSCCNSLRSFQSPCYVSQRNHWSCENCFVSCRSLSLWELVLISHSEQTRYW